MNKLSKAIARATRNTNTPTRVKGTVADPWTLTTTSPFGWQIVGWMNLDPVGAFRMPDANLRVLVLVGVSAARLLYPEGPILLSLGRMVCRSGGIVESRRSLIFNSGHRKLWRRGRCTQESRVMAFRLCAGRGCSRCEGTLRAARVRMQCK